jgi:hypothetical protein
MQLINKTKWDSKLLRKLCSVVVKHHGTRKNHRIRIETCKKRYCDYSGYAWISGKDIVMQVPPIARLEYRQPMAKGENGKWIKDLIPSQFNSIRFAQILEHEIAHNLGIREHKNMVRSTDLNCDYAKEFVVLPQEMPVKPQIDRIQLRKDKAEKMLKLHTSRLKRQQNLVKKWQRKVHYYAQRGKHDNLQNNEILS